MTDGEEWVDLSLAIGVRAFAVNGIVTMNEDGAGRAILLSVINGDEDAFHFIMDPHVAGRIGFEMIGTTTGHLGEYIEENFAPDWGDDEED